jgi:hypothetical protein
MAAGSRAAEARPLIGRAQAEDEGPSGPPAPASPNWQPDIPGHGANLEDLRCFFIRELGRLNANGHMQAQSSYQARLDIEALKRLLDTKAEATAVTAQFVEDHTIFETQVNMLNDGLTDFKKQLDLKPRTAAVQAKMAEDHAVIEAKFTSMNEVLADFETQSKRTSLVETDFKQHVAGHFAETVAAMQWLDASIDGRLAQAKTATEERMDKVDGQFRAFLSDAAVAA